jgi:hypothetical protein
VAEYTIVPEKPVSYCTTLKYFKLMLKDTGFDFNLFGLHSPRIGATGDAFENKIPHHVIDKQGRWKCKNSKFGYLAKNEQYFLNVLSKN